MSAFTESVVEDAALAWLQNLAWTIKHGLEIVPGEPFPERGDYSQVVLTQRMRDALANRFRDSKNPFKIVLVRDMWLTGFDAPSLRTRRYQSRKALEEPHARAPWRR